MRNYQHTMVSSYVLCDSFCLVSISMLNFLRMIVLTSLIILEIDVVVIFTLPAIDDDFFFFFRKPFLVLLKR